MMKQGKNEKLFYFLWKYFHGNGYDPTSLGPTNLTDFSQGAAYAVGRSEKEVRRSQTISWQKGGTNFFRKFWIFRFRK